eukprot:4638066-Prymnesium_polylepis.1
MEARLTPCARYRTLRSQRRARVGPPASQRTIRAHLRSRLPARCSEAFLPYRESTMPGYVPPRIRNAQEGEEARSGSPHPIASCAATSCCNMPETF